MDYSVSFIIHDKKFDENREWKFNFERYQDNEQAFKEHFLHGKVVTTQLWYTKEIMVKERYAKRKVWVVVHKKDGSTYKARRRKKIKIRAYSYKRQFVKTRKDVKRAVIDKIIERANKNDRIRYKKPNTWNRYSFIGLKKIKTYE